MDNKSIIIIGGGLGGLFTGAILAKERYRVTVIEKNTNIGGGLQTFVRDKNIFETGMHILGGFRKGGSIHKICSYLGIMDRLELMDVDADCMDSLHFFSDNCTYEISEGRENFVSRLSAYFPEEKENIHKYVDALYNIADEVDFFYLKSGRDEIFSHSEKFLWSADEFIAYYINNPRLRAILAYMNPMYGGVAKHTPAYIHALINVLYINGASRFIGGSQQLASALSDIITSNGGEIISGKSVIHIEVKDKVIQYVKTNDNTMYIADKYISAIHPCSLLSIMDESAFPRSYRNRLNEIPNTYSAFTVYLVLKSDYFPYINHTCYCQDDYDTVWDYGQYDDNIWPHGFMYMTPPVMQQGKFSKKLIITTPMSFNAVRKWKDTTIGNRGLEYKQWKNMCAEILISKLSLLYPQLRENIEKIYTSTPLTIRDYYNVKDGAMYGFRKDCQNIALSQVPIYTKISNLLLTGQNINLHGICGVPLTAINTVEAIVGKNNIIEKINNVYEH